MSTDFGKVVQIHVEQGTEGHTWVNVTLLTPVAQLDLRNRWNNSILKRARSVYSMFQIHVLDKIQVTLINLPNII